MQSHIKRIPLRRSVSPVHIQTIAHRLKRKKGKPQRNRRGQSGGGTPRRGIRKRQQRPGQPEKRQQKNVCDHGQPRYAGAAVSPCFAPVNPQAQHPAPQNPDGQHRQINRLPKGVKHKACQQQHAVLQRAGKKAQIIQYDTGRQSVYQKCQTGSLHEQPPICGMRNTRERQTPRLPAAEPAACKGTRRCSSRRTFQARPDTDRWPPHAGKCWF
ncbi:hypothetical protein SDC9_136045 [bioreactor metagenome]|uniref:Uncharacterized protein n=1 Tax=bioreactor metagenome TaxID=1076179 RepID=A0A645DI80_9ZZZZ